MVNESRAAAPTDQAGLQFLRAVIAAEGALAAAPPASVLEELRALAAAWHSTGDWPPDLRGQPCSAPAPDWHLHCLTALNAEPDSAATRARRLYHARWLGHLLRPDRPEFRPIATVLIPTYNRAAMTVEAVESCLAQTWRPIEVLVVDDGSTDDIVGALARFGPEVRLVRKENGGVSSARNAGIAVARGDLIHFLDSDNLLMPLSVARKVDAFARIADAELCYNAAAVSGRDALRAALGRESADRPKESVPLRPVDAAYPTSQMLNSDSRGGFYVSCVMIPRFTLLTTGPFDEDLRRTEDTVYWFRLALRQTKAIRVEAELALRRLTADGLSVRPKPVWLNLLFTLRTARLVLAHPRHWPVFAHSMAIVRSIVVDQADHAPMTPANHAELAKLAAEIGALEHNGGLSTLPLLAHCRHLLAGRAATAGGDPMARLASAVHAAALRAAPLSEADLIHWRDTAVTVSGNGRLNAFCRRAATAVAQSADALPLVDELLRHRSGIPKPAAIRRYLSLRRLRVPRSLALRLCR